MLDLAGIPVRHSYHIVNGTLVIKEYRIDVNVLGAGPDNDLAPSEQMKSTEGVGKPSACI